ncbi:MAG: site-specific integrase [Alistipes sp.]|nr:site-specific integrase [Alistipes sp.]MDE6779421.1 site-specific integrase [Alistipes sp.]
MRNTFRILFYVKRSALLRDGRAPIMVRITVNGERVQLSTQQAVAPQKWDVGSGRVGGRSDEARRINEALELVRGRIVRCYDRLQRAEERISPAKIKEMYLGAADRRMLLAFFRSHNDEFERMVGVTRSRNTYYKYRCVYMHLENFISEKYRCDDIPLHSVDTRLVTEFHRYICRESRCKGNTVWVYMIALKHVVMLARSRGYIARDPFLGYKLRSEPTSRNYLSLDEVRRIIALPLPSPALRLVRDMFLFSCFTGLSYVDLRNLRFENIETVDRELWLNTSRRKTGAPVSVRLFDLPRAIIARYSSETRNGLLFRLPSNGWCNLCLRRIMTMSGIDRRITFHSARHTFATSMTLSQGVAIETISKLLGHKNIRTTQIYADITHQHLNSEMNLLSKRIGKINYPTQKTV